MTEHEASRTLVKSPPELWAECSDPTSLARHLNGSFGEIRITRLEPETAVAWEGEHASGTVKLEASGWGTKVILTAQPLGAGEEAVEEEPASPDPVPAPAPAPPRLAPARRPSLLARLRRMLRPAPAAIALAPEARPQPEAPPPPEPEPVEPAPEPDPQASAALTAALESLGQAHHRPFSRA